MTNGKRVAEEFIRLTHSELFNQNKWQWLLDENFKFRRRNDDEDYDKGVQLHTISSVTVPFLNKKQFIDFLEDRYGDGPHSTGFWKIKDFSNNITKHDNLSFEIDSVNNNIVVECTGNENYYVTQRIIYYAEVSSTCKILDLKAHYKPTTVMIEAI